METMATYAPPAPASSPARLPHLTFKGELAPAGLPADAKRSPSKSPTKTPAPPREELNQKDAIDAVRAATVPSQPPQQQQSTTESTLSSFVSPTTLESHTTLTHVTTTAAVGSATNVAALDGEPVKEVISDPESPAFAALIKASVEKPDVSLLEKRPRIGHSKLGRHKYKPGNKSFKKPTGEEINNEHEQYALTYGMMCGILNSAGLQNPFKQRLTMDDFMRVDKRVFPPNSKLQHPFKFKDYSPDIFRQIRRRFCIDSADYMVTLCGDFNYIEFMSNSKSGQFFFYSHDGRFMIKTQTKEESKFLRRILPHYYKFVMENPNTLITRFYGMHRVKMHHLRRKMHFIIMASVFDTPLDIHARFDLKGSTVGRRGTDKDRRTHGVLKDMDLVDSGFRLQVGAEKRAMMLVQIRKDVEFLKRMKIMDYSLLIGVHDVRGQVQKKIYGSLHPEQPVSKSLPASPIGDTTGAADAAFPNGELPVRLARSVSVPEDNRNGMPNDRMPIVMAPSPRSPVGASAATASQSRATHDEASATSSYAIEGGDVEFDSDSSDDNESLSNVSDLDDGFAVDRLPGGRSGFELAPHLQPHGSHAVLTPGTLQSVPSMASSLHALEPISPRVLDANRFPGHSESVFCKDDGGIYGRDRHGRKNGYVYFVGVIDILQQYNTRKIAETFFKGLRHNRKEISAVNPVLYGDRFIEFMEKNVILDATLVDGGVSMSSRSMAAAATAAGASASASSSPVLTPMTAPPASPASLSTLQQL